MKIKRNDINDLKKLSLTISSPDIFITYNVNRFKKGDILLIRGKVERRMDKYQIIVDKIRILYD